MRHPSLLFRIPLAFALTLSAAACGGRGGPGTDEPPEVIAAEGVSDVEVRPLSAEQRAIFYHLAEGSELVPVAWVKALRNPYDRSKRFLENPERFGLISDPSNADGLPIGATADYTVDTRFLGVRLLGFNCSACHVNEITYQGNRFRIDGGPSRFNGDSLNAELSLAIQQTKQPLNLIQFIIDLLRESAPQPGTDTVGQTGATGRVVHRTPRQKAMALSDTRRPAPQSMLSSLVDGQRTAEEDRFIAALDRELRADSAQNPPMNLHDVSMDSSSAQFQALMRRYQAVRAEGARDRLFQALPAVHRSRPEPERRSILGSIEEILATVRMLNDRLSLLKSVAGGGGGTGGGPALDNTPDGPGRVDAFGVARNRLYPEGPVPLTAPVSFPHLWGFAQNTWLHYDANTNSVMERNIGQALGVGGVFDPVTLKSSLNPINLHALELLARQLPEPRWPAFFPPIDQAKASQGAPLFGQYCAGCHTSPPPRPQDVCYPLNAVWTDSLRARNFARPLGNGRFTDSVAPLLRTMKNMAYQTFQVPLADRPAMNGIPDNQVVWRTTGMYGVRDLRGAWATAPYLHNGSVPSLYELLLPAGQRSKTFPLGHPEYDPVRVGYTMNAPAGTPRFNTALAGNSNVGHEYGTNLPEPQRLALLEYLKTLGRYTGPVTAQPGATACPTLTGRGPP